MRYFRLMRIASLQPSISITLKALGRLDALCACTKYCVEAVPELAASEVPIIHDSWSADTAEILTAKPDLVMASVPYRLETLAAILKAGLPVVALAPHSLEDVYSDTHLIASIVGAREAGEALVAKMRDAVSSTLCVAGASDSKPLVYCEEWGKPLIHSQLWVAELVEAAGGRFLGEPGSHTTAEDVAAANPDVMVFSWCGAGDRVPLAKVVAGRGWADLDAVRGGRVHCVPDEWLNTPAITLLDGLECLAGICHPGLFEVRSRVISLTRESAGALTLSAMPRTL